MKFLLDTNVVVHWLRNRHEVVQKISEVGVQRCFISEITLMELYYGAECSQRVQENVAIIDSFVKDVEMVPITNAIREACRQKAMLKRKGQMIEDSDLLIGCTAITHDMVLVTENVAHMNRLSGVKIENWVER